MLLDIQYYTIFTYFGNIHLVLLDPLNHLLHVLLPLVLGLNACGTLICLWFDKISDPHKNLYRRYVLYYRDTSYETPNMHTSHPDFDRIRIDLQGWICNSGLLNAASGHSVGQAQGRT